MDWTRTGRAILGVLAAGLAGQHAIADDKAPEDTCETITLAGNAEAVEQKLNNVAAISAKALNSNALLLCAAASKYAAARQAVSVVAGESQRSESKQVRLFFHRDASGLATALDKAIGGIGVSQGGPDLLVFKSSGEPGDEVSIRSLKRLITIIDAPRPEITLNAWSVRISSGERESVNAVANTVHETVYSYNRELQEALRRAWLFLSIERNKQDRWAKYFSTYVIDKHDRSSTGLPCQRSDGTGERYKYCLGYEDAFSEVMQPSITNMIGILAGLEGPKLDALVNNLEGRAEGTVIDPSQDPCNSRDEHDYADPARRTGRTPRFYCFREQLQTSLKPKSLELARIRAAMADFLFQYKFSIEYSDDFEAYDYARSAQLLDVELDPLLVAFNHDLVVYLKALQSDLRCHPRGRSSSPPRNCFDAAKDAGYGDSGIVTIRTISGTDSSVSATTQSAFKTTPPPLVQDFLTQLQNTPSAIPSVISKNLPPNGAEALVAFLNSGKAATVNLGRDLNLTATPYTLPGASAAELKITLENKDDANGPTKVTPDGKNVADTANRVGLHALTTNVRVDSLKLFEVSTLSVELSRGRDPIPLIPPLVELPYIPPLLKYPLKPSRAYHQSFAIVSATILPTAADMVNGLRYSRDRGDALADPAKHEFAKTIRDFHGQMLKCIVETTLAEQKAVDKSECRSIQQTPTAALNAAVTDNVIK
jgi:hypothetical protein